MLLVFHNIIQTVILHYYYVFQHRRAITLVFINVMKMNIYL